jgi:predicted nucleic acid-binding protein
MIMVDSTVWISYFNGRITPETDFLDSVLTTELILVGDIILAEVLQGFRRDEDFRKALKALFGFRQVSIPKRHSRNQTGV